MAQTQRSFGCLPRTAAARPCRKVLRCGALRGYRHRGTPTWRPFGGHPHGNVVDGVPDYVARALRRIAEQPVTSAEPEGVVGHLQRLCGAAVLELSAHGVSVSVLAAGGLRGVTVASDPSTERIEELQLLLGEGACVDALASRQPVLVGDLNAMGMSRWPLYTPALYDDGIRAVFAFPLQVGAAQLGVLNIYRRCVGALSADALKQAFTFAEIAVSVLLDSQDNAMSGAAGDGLEEAVEHHAVLFQAQGTVMVQLGVTLVEALARIRAYAFAENRRLIDVAHDVVARTVIFKPDPYEFHDVDAPDHGSQA